MGRKKEVIAASLLAISLALGLGLISLGFFGGTPPIKETENVLDVYTQKGGLKGGTGLNASGGDFEPMDTVFLYADLTSDGVAVNNSSITFIITKPDSTQILRPATTNGSGTANTYISLLPSEGHVVGTWYVAANTTLNSRPVVDTLSLLCQTLQAQIILSVRRDGTASSPFLPNETVVVEAQLSYRNAQFNETPISFSITSPNQTVFLTRIVPADMFGISAVSFVIPWPSDSSLGIWQISATSEIFEQPVNTTLSIDCIILPPAIDVFTQKAGRGPNMAGGSFALGEAVLLYAEFRDELNQTVPYLQVAFDVIDPVMNVSSPRVQSLNESGIANITHRVPNDQAYVGLTFKVVVSANYLGTVAMDTLTFIAKTV